MYLRSTFLSPLFIWYFTGLMPTCCRIDSNILEELIPEKFHDSRETMSEAADECSGGRIFFERYITYFYLLKLLQLFYNFGIICMMIHRAWLCRVKRHLQIAEFSLNNYHWSLKRCELGFRKIFIFQRP